MKTIINDSESFPKIVKFCEKYFHNVRVVKNENSRLAKHSQNFVIVILFENRGNIFSIKWSPHNSRLFFGDITINKKTSLHYTFTKIQFDECYPIEEGNNANIMFWQYELTNPHNSVGEIISPLRLPITIRS